MNKLFLIFILTVTAIASAKDADKGLLPEVRINSKNEDENQTKAVATEVMIAKAEGEAIKTLQGLIHKRKGQPEESGLWYRLAELYMRRAKSGRFFDMVRNTQDAVKFAPPSVREESAKANLRKAIDVYNKIESQFPKFDEMDAVHFNSAFANQQLGEIKIAEKNYLKLIKNFPDSPLVPDARLALGEMLYDNKRFAEALDHFKAIDKYPNSRVYAYGIYKTAWTHYNLHDNEFAIDRLIQVVRYFDPNNPNRSRANHNLRTESLRDLALFFGETHKADYALEFFSKLASGEELGDCMINLGKLYESYSRQKEMNIFLNDYIKKYPEGSHRVRAHLLLVEANETLKDRKEVLKQLQISSQVCSKDSSWRKQFPKAADEQCDFDFAKINIDIAKKWWELWLKNKQNNDIADLTKSAFKIHLDREDPSKPDVKSRYAYAELLFQLNEFRMASAQYEITSDKATDSTMQHDSSYSALVALEKASEKSKDSSDNENLIRLGMKYLAKHAKGVHSYQVQFKIGFINYELRNLNEAEKWLRPLAQDKKSAEFKRKSEDLVLDILNSRKDYVGIKSFSKELLTQTAEADRRQQLTKIMQEADYASIQEYLKTGEKVEAAKKLYSYYQEHKSSTFAKDALWQSLSLLYSSYRNVDAADESREYAKEYSDDKRSLDALKDAVKAYTETGYLTQAAEVLEILALRSEGDDSMKFIEAAAEINLLEGRRKQARQTFEKLLTEKNKSNHGKIYTKILATMKGQENSEEYHALENRVAALGHEPFASQVAVRKIQALYDAKKYTEAFNASKPLVGGNAPDESKAMARLIQAQILELELVNQSTRASVEKLQLVLSLKTEKLDKAQTAYLSAAKMSKDPNVQAKALEGLNRCYTNFVESVRNAQIKAELTEQDKKALQTELTKLTQPILDKKIDTDKKLQDLAKNMKATSSSSGTDFANLSVQETAYPIIRDIDTEKLKVFLPVISEKSDFERFELSSKDKCDYKETDRSMEIKDLAKKANICISLKNYAQAEKLALDMSRKDPRSAWGPYYLSVIAGLSGLAEKSLYLADLASKKDPDAVVVSYQKGIALLKTGDRARGNAEFIKAYDYKFPANELAVIHGTVSYAQGNCLSMIEDFDRLNKNEMKDFGLYPALSECHALKGDVDKGLSIAQNAVEKDKNQIDLWLQLGRLYEKYKFDSSSAAQSYENALRAQPSPDVRDWLQRKVLYLKGTTKVTVLEPRHVLSEKTGSDQGGGL